MTTGSTLRFGVQVGEMAASGGRAGGVRLADGTTIKADAVIAGIGITPNVQLAEAAGLKVGNGIVTDERLCTSDPDIYAAGDVANAYHPLLGKHIGVEHWYNALHSRRPRRRRCSARMPPRTGCRTSTPTSTT